MKYEKIREYLLNNEKTLLRVVGDLNSYNGCLENLDFWLNDGDFFSCCFENPIDAVRTTYYGDYNYNDDYVKINAYGNIDSYTEEEKNEEIKDNIDPNIQLHILSTPIFFYVVNIIILFFY